MHDRRRTPRRGRLAGWWICFVAAMLFGHTAPAFSQAPASTPCQATEGPVYLGGRDRERTSVVVFVHGVLSSVVSAWARDAGSSWPCILRSEPAFDNSNIYLYGYETALLGASPSVEKVARQFLIDLDNDGVLGHAHITIVAHSMGGLVTARMLMAMHAQVDMRPNLRRIKLVNFFGTPATGADIANVAALISGSAQFEEMLPGAGQLTLVDEWAKIDWPFTWYCLAEGKKTGWKWVFGTLVVPKDSATALCRNRPDGSKPTLERFDHISMVKPSSLQDSPHRYLRRYFMSCVKDALPKAHPPSEAHSPDGQVLLQALGRLQRGMSDTSPAGRNARLAIVQETLHQSVGLVAAAADAYLWPVDLNRSSLVADAFRRDGSRPFSLEFINFFEGDPSELQAMWVGRLEKLDRYVPDAQLTELRRAWTAAGHVQDSDLVVPLKPRASGEQVVLLGSVQDAGGARQGRLRGLLILPAQAKTCL